MEKRPSLSITDLDPVASSLLMLWPPNAFTLTHSVKHTTLAMVYLVVSRDRLVINLRRSSSGAADSLALQGCLCTMQAVASLKVAGPWWACASVPGKPIKFRRLSNACEKTKIYFPSPFCNGESTSHTTLPHWHNLPSQSINGSIFADRAETLLAF